MKRLIICLLLICAFEYTHSQGWSDYFKKEFTQLEGLYLSREEGEENILFLFTSETYQVLEEDELSEFSYFSFELPKTSIIELEGTNSFLINSPGINIEEYLYKNEKTYYTSGGFLYESSYLISVSQEANPRVKGVYRIRSLKHLLEDLKTQPEDFIMQLDVELVREERLETQKSEWQKKFSIYTPLLNGLIITIGSDAGRTLFVLRRDFDAPYTYVFWLRDDEVQEIPGGGVILAVNEATTVYKSYFDHRGHQHDPIFNFANGIYYLELESTDTLESTVVALFSSLDGSKLYIELRNGEINLSVPSAFKRSKLSKK